MPTAEKDNKSVRKEMQPKSEQVTQKFKTVFIFSNLRIFFSQVFIEESKMSRFKPPQKMGDISSRFLGQLSDIRTWVIT